MKSIPASKKLPPPLPKPKHHIGVYAGSFDPPTKGHFDIITRASGMFNQLYVAVAYNISKNAIFTTEEKIKMLRANLMIPNVVVTDFSGLIVDLCKKIGATTMVRGVRNIMDFETEMNMAHVNSDLAHDVNTILIPTRLEYMTVSSSMVKELAKFGRDVSQYVHPHVAMALKEKFAQK